MMTPTRNSPVILHADQEHSGLRTAVFILLFVTLVLFFFGIRALIGALTPGSLPDYAFVAACGGALPLALGTVWLVEILMKRYWPSGRAILLTHNGVHARSPEKEFRLLDQNDNLESLFWYFDMHGWQRGGRERRVPRTWICMAAELSAGKHHLIIYTYMPRAKARNWLDADKGQINFHQITPKDVYDNSIRARMSGPSRPEVPAAVLTGADGKYWLGERRRWTEGFELSPAGFEQFLQHIQTTLKL